LLAITDLLVDDGSEDEFGRELAIRNELIKFFSFRDDMMTCSSTDLAATIRNRPAETKRSVPVVCLVYGGGVNSLQTVLDHVSAHDPILVVRGSGRAADLIDDWKQLCDHRASAVARGKEAWKEHAKMRSKARAWLLNNTDLEDDSDDDDDATVKRMDPEDRPHPEDEPLAAEIEGFCARLDRIAVYPDLHFAEWRAGEEASGILRGIDMSYKSILHSTYPCL